MFENKYFVPIDIKVFGNHLARGFEISRCYIDRETNSKVCGWFWVQGNQELRQRVYSKEQFYALLEQYSLVEE